MCLTPEGCQNQDWVCVSLRRGARIRIGCVSRSGGVPESGLGVCLAPEGWRDMDCESRKARAQKGEGLLTKHPRSLPIGIYASCKTGRLRARKRLTPLSKKLSPGLSKKLSPESYRMSPHLGVFDLPHPTRATSGLVMPRVKRGRFVLRRATNPAKVQSKKLRISPQDDLQTRATSGLVFAKQAAAADVAGSSSRWQQQAG